MQAALAVINNHVGCYRCLCRFRKHRSWKLPVIDLANVGIEEKQIGADECPPLANIILVMLLGCVSQVLAVDTKPPDGLTDAGIDHRDVIQDIGDILRLPPRHA